MISRYRTYLKFLDDKLEQLFEAQKPFIKCQKGCAYCCKEGEYPISELEYINMMFYYNELDNSIKDKINENITSLLAQKREKLYICPFLIDNSCSIYPARSIICRTFGLITYYKDERKKLPFCIDLGLNYSNVYNNNLEEINNGNVEGFTPIAYNIDRRLLRSVKAEKEYDIFFGDDKPMVEWLAEEFLG